MTFRNKKQGVTLINPIAQTKVKIESFESLNAIWRDPVNLLHWNCLFVLPPWIETWWTIFGAGKSLSICSIWKDNQIIGIAPLYIEEKDAYIIGDEDICDFMDFVIGPNKEEDFFTELFRHLRHQGVDCLHIGSMRGDSSSVSSIMDHAERLQCVIHAESSGRLYCLDLPDTWDRYLKQLTQKDRHEIRRKLRRLEQYGNIDIRLIEETQSLNQEMDMFIRLFRMNVPDKSQFMTDTMESFFRLLADRMAEAGMLNILFLDINNDPASSVMCFYYDSSVYLYNNGYNRAYKHLSVGQLSKVFSIKESIRRKKKSFNFLKGDEQYKRYMGGKAEPLLSCRIELK